MHPVDNVYETLHYAIEHPIGSKRLEDLVNKDSHIVICFDDISVPLPLMRADVRAIAAEVVLEKLESIGVLEENILFICATGLHRKCKSKEFAYLLGKKVYSQYKSQVFNHNALDRANLKMLGSTKDGYKIEINSYAAEADLIIYLNISFTPLNGGWKSIIVGLGSFNTIIPHHSPVVLKENSFMDPKNSKLHQIIWEMGDIIKDKINVFTIELILNNRFFSGFFEKLYHPLRIPSVKIPLIRRLTLSLFRKAPNFIKSSVRKKIRAGYQLIAVYTGDIEKVHEKTLEVVNKQLLVPIKQQYDVIIYGVPNVSPYNVGSTLNPLLLHTLVSGYLYNMHNGRTPLKKGGCLIIYNPAYEKFDLKQHPSYKDFYYDVLSRKPDIYNLKNIEQEYLHNQNYLNKYQNNYAYHGVHAPIAYYWGVLGLLNVKKVIVAGAKNTRTLKVFGYEYAKNLDEAIILSKKEMGDNCSIAYFCIPPIFITEYKESQTERKL